MSNSRSQTSVWTKVFDYYMPFAMMGDSAAQFEIAEIWRLHYRCKILAYHWYCQSALGGHHKAAMNAACIALTTQPPDYASAIKWSDIAIEGDMEGAKLVRSIVRRHATFAHRHNTNTAM